MERCDCKGERECVLVDENGEVFTPSFWWVIKSEKKRGLGWGGFGWVVFWLT